VNGDARDGADGEPLTDVDDEQKEPVNDEDDACDETSDDEHGYGYRYGYDDDDDVYDNDVSDSTVQFPTGRDDPSEAGRRRDTRGTRSESP